MSRFLAYGTLTKHVVVAVEADTMEDAQNALVLGQHDGVVAEAAGCGIFRWCGAVGTERHLQDFHNQWITQSGRLRSGFDHP